MNLESESNALQAILGKEETVSSFLANIYQLKAKVFRACNKNNHNEELRAIKTASTILNKVVELGDDGLADFLHRSRCLFSPFCPISSLSRKSVDKGKPTISPPLIFHKKTPLDHSEIQNKYNSNPFAAYLDGCSIIQNHAQLISPAFFDLTQDLQKTFPHVFVNTYLTPPHSQAVNAHADDRDVFVLQLLGKKHWKIYNQIPIPHPYPEEQVGKFPDLPVSSDVFQKGTYLDIILSPGDVLYIPRGWVHEANTNVSSDQEQIMSFHATIALATHDWTLARMASEEFQKCINSMHSHRLALSPSLSMTNENDKEFNEEKKRVNTDPSCDTNKLERILEKDIDSMMEMAKSHITAQLIKSKYQQKRQHHNAQMKQMFDFLSPLLSQYKHQYFSISSDRPKPNIQSKCVGPLVACCLTLTSNIRVGSTEERDSAPPPLDINGKQRPKGVSIAEENICSTLLSILSMIKQSPPKTTYQVSDLFAIFQESEDGFHPTCDRFSLLSFVKCCVELGALALAS